LKAKLFIYETMLPGFCLRGSKARFTDSIKLNLERWNWKWVTGVLVRSLFDSLGGGVNLKL